jgi:hypothetical protein
MYRQKEYGIPCSDWLNQGYLTLSTDKAVDRPVGDR